MGDLFQQYAGSKRPLLSQLHEMLDDEQKAGPEYRALAAQARERGKSDMATQLERIAADEDRHAIILSGLIASYRAMLESETHAVATTMRRRVPYRR